MRKTLIVLALILAVGVAFAQATLPEPTWNPSAWFVDAAALAAVVAAAIAFLKANVVKSLTGWGTVAASFGLAVAAAVVASFTSLYDAQLMEAASFGASAGLLASGGWDVIRGLLGKR